MLRRTLLVVAVIGLAFALLVGAGAVGYYLGRESADRRIDIYHHRDQNRDSTGGGFG